MKKNRIFPVQIFSNQGSKTGRPALLWQLFALLSVFLYFPSCQKETPSTQQAPDMLSAAKKKAVATEVPYQVFATELNNPRGLKFGPDGYLYVAEGGLGGTNMTQCTQVIPPVGPYTGSETGGGISKISPTGVRTVVTASLPSSQTSPLLGSLVSGVADVAFVGNTLYALLAGAGCSHGVSSVPNGIVKVNPDGSWTMIANLSAWQQAHPVARPEEGDFEPDGTWYSMINVRGDLYAIEPNHCEMVKVTTGGNISRVVDISDLQGHIVPTAVTYHGNFFVGNLGVFPVVPGSSKIFKITPSGNMLEWISGLTAVVGIEVDQQGRLYVLESTTVAAPGPVPGTGKVLRVDRSGKVETITSGLSLPTAMTFGPDGNLYVSNWGYGKGPGGGEVVKIPISD